MATKQKNIQTNEFYDHNALTVMETDNNTSNTKPSKMSRILVILLVTFIGLIGTGAAYANFDALSVNGSRQKRAAVEMAVEHSAERVPEKRESPNAVDSLEDRQRTANSVLRHHAVHTEINSHINLQDFMKAAAEKAKLKFDKQKEEAAATSATDKNSEPSEETSLPIIESELLRVEKLPEFDICPIMPELPGESGSIRKVREIERQNVQKRVTDKISSFNQTASGCTADCHVGCPEGTYRLPGMAECKPRLNCTQIRSLTKDRNLIGGGGVKRIYTADMDGNSVVIARVKRFKFNQYLDSMVELQQTGIVAQLIGMCDEPAWPEVVLQYHSLGSLLTVSQLPDSIPLRWRIIMSYLDVVEKLHNRVPRSPRVLCDASRTEITLSQFLLTDDFRVVLNDVDELIAAGADGKVRCNCNIIRGGSEYGSGGSGNTGCLVPPEQKQCGTNVFYTEKIDIWKIPDITKAILGESDEANKVWDELHRVHQECKQDNAHLRPPIEYIVDKYRKLQEKMQIPAYIN